METRAGPVWWGHHGGTWWEMLTMTKPLSHLLHHVLNIFHCPGPLLRFHLIYNMDSNIGCPVFRCLYTAQDPSLCPPSLRCWALITVSSTDNILCPQSWKTLVFCFISTFPFLVPAERNVWAVFSLSFSRFRCSDIFVSTKGHSGLTKLWTFHSHYCCCCCHHLNSMHLVW